MIRRILLLIALLLVGASSANAQQTVAPPPFPAGVDITPLDVVAVWQDGRIKSYDSFARSIMQSITGPREINGQSPPLTYLDLMLRPEAYDGAPIYFVKKKPFRAILVDAALGSVDPPSREELEAFMETGLASKTLLDNASVRDLLARLRSDVLRFAKPVDAIEAAVNLSDPTVLRRLLILLPPFSGQYEDPWMTIDEYQVSSSRLDPNAASADPMVQAWNAVVAAWNRQDTAAANAAIARLGQVLPMAGRARLAEYPSEQRLHLESAYFKWKGFTWIWMIYLVSIIFFLMAIVYRWSGARWGGIAFFSAAFMLQTFALVLRWYVSGRWPNTNMFEAVTTSTWFGGCFAIIMEAILGRTRVKNLFFLGSAAASMFALMAASFSPLQLSPHFSNRMPVLHDVWLYIHTNVIIFSYVLIFLAFVSAGLYMLVRFFRFTQGERDIREHVGTGGIGSLIVRRRGGKAALLDSRTSFGAVLDGTTMILVELSFILLWAGLVMGAIWADHSWGRPWGWDPKEVFALNTFLIYAILIHVRYRASDKGLWTAFLAVVGCGVMLFNWIVINFTISGLHSYA
ncbi:MAG: hypothetical protein CMJ41_05545 [Phycisphaerae bacterium]|nr:hypothetical protein [Phycisphaerae bacterium]